MRKPPLIFLAFLLVFAGICLNERQLLTLLGIPGFPLPAILVIRIFNAACVALGVLVVLFRNNSKALSGLALSVAATIGFLVFAEIATRIMDASVPKLKLVRDNPSGYGSFRLRENLHLATRVEGRRVMIKTNSRGMAGLEVFVEKPAGKIRVAFAGDSFAFGCWADSPEMSAVGIFGAAAPPNRFDLLNFGVVGFGPPDVELLLREEILKFKPDVLVYMFYVGNDISDAYYGVNKYKVVDNTLVWREKEGHDFAAAAKEFLSGFSLFRVFSLAVNKMEARRELRLWRPLTPAVVWSMRQYSDIESRSLTLALDSLRKINAICRNNAIRLALVVIPFAEQVHAPTLQTPVYDFSRPQIFLKAFAQENDITYFDMLPSLREHVRKTNQEIYLTSDPHFNNEGHAVCGRLMAKFVTETYGNL